MELWGSLTQHSWGKIGNDSRAGIYYWHSKKRNLLDEEATYSTVIFSADKSNNHSPTLIASRYEALYLFINNYPQVLGKQWDELYNGHLPYQVRIVSLQKATPLRCHPPKEHAERLHLTNPEIYASDEQKPKLVISLLNLELLAGFRSKEEIFAFLRGIPELAIIAPYESILDYLYCGKVKHLKRVLYFLLSATHQEMKLSLDIFFTRMEAADEEEKAAVNYNLLKKLHQEYPYDCGVYASLFFNRFELSSGEAVFIPSGTVHAYLEGDCIEVSASSENIVRCGLTDMYRDVDEFLAIADFSPTSPESLIYRPTVINKYLTSFTPPAKEFGVFHISVPAEKSYTIEEQESCSMVLVIRGSAMLEDSRIIKLGTTLLLLPYHTLTFKVRKDITLYVVYPNPDAPEGEYGKLF